MASGSLVEELQGRIRELEEELRKVKSSHGCHRDKIDKMSAEVLDSNPYR